VRGFAPEREREVEAIRTRIRAEGHPLPGAILGVHDTLLALGMNPGGPDYSLQGFGRPSARSPWTLLYDWRFRPPRPRPRRDLGPDAAQLRDDSLAALNDECVASLFRGGGMDYESLGLAWATTRLAGSAPSDFAEQLVASRRSDSR
jgi:hypothetical protein